LLSGLPTVATALRRGKMTPKTALGHPHKAPEEVRELFDEIDDRPQRDELNLYVVGYEEPAPGEISGNGEEEASASADEEASAPAGEERS
jgi:hypothetical protein